MTDRIPPRLPRQPRPLRRFHVEHLVPVNDAAPGHCRECGCSSVPCPYCVDRDGVHVRYPLTDQVRDVTHIAICAKHGAIGEKCEVRTHYARPIDMHVDGLEPVAPPVRVVWAVSIALLAGFLCGAFMGVFAIAPLIMLR